jgi:peptidoglycan hydrolase CwlO-like protein
MNKKYAIILAAACIVCLGIGIFIGGGLSQNNLSATGASIGSVQNINIGSQVDALTAQIEDMQKNIQDIQGRIQAKVSYLQGINDKLSAAGKIRGDVIVMTGKGDSANMTSSVYNDCIGMGVNVPCQPGVALNIEGWKKLASKITDHMDALQADADTARSDIDKLNQEYENALNQMATLTQQLHDAMMRDVQKRDKAQ